MSNTVRFVFVLFQPTQEERRRSWDIVIDNTQNNRGYGAAANEGIKNALANGARWIVVCNQDIELTKQDKEKFIKTLNNSAPGIVGPEVGSLDQKRWTTILTEGDGFRLRGRNDNQTIDYISGSCMASHKNVFEKIGYFYEPYFMYYEDADFSVRAKKAGFPLRQIHLNNFRHEATSPEKNKDLHLFRNHLLFVLRLAPWQVKLYELLRLPKTIYDYWR